MIKQHKLKFLLKVFIYLFKSFVIEKQWTAEHTQKRMKRQKDENSITRLIPVNMLIEYHC